MTDEFAPSHQLDDYSPDGGDVVDETVMDVIRDDDPEWDILAVDVADDLDDDVLLLLVFRRKVSDDGNLILSERYFRFDRTRPEESSFTQNGIERRIEGALGPLLKVVYTALNDGLVESDDPMMIDSRDGGLDYDPEVLTEAIRSLGSVDDDDDDGEPVDYSKRSVESDAHTAECQKCGRSGVVGEDLVNFGGGVVDAFVHEGDCPEDGDQQ